MKKKIIILSLVLLLAVFVNIAYAQSNEKVEVSIPKFNIKVNGSLVDNKSSKYPMIVYNNTTYLPLSDDYCEALGLSVVWDSAKGFEITQNFNYDSPKQDLSAKNDLNIKHYSEISSFRITINGEEIINDQEEYPILFFRDTVYMPITWRFAKVFGWNLYWDAEDGLNVIGNSPFVRDEIIVGEWIYYAQEQNIFKMKLDGSEKTVFADAGYPYEMIVVDDWIYYINGSDEDKLYKIRTDGTNKTKISEEKVEELIGVDEWIYYISNNNYILLETNEVYKMKLDGSAKSKVENLKLDFLSFPVLKDDWIYYRDLEDSSKLYKIRTNGTDKTKLLDEEVPGVKIVGDWIYYINSSDELNRMKLDGSNKTKLLDEKVYYNYFIKDEWLYYGNINDKDKLYKIKLDGTNRTKLNNERSSVIDVIGEWIYYKNHYGLSGDFLKLARTNMNSGVTENILPNGPEKYYYANGIRIQGQGADNWSWQKDQYEKEYYMMDRTIEELAELSEAIVLINTFNEKGEIISQGSGVVISDDGLIATNLHVIYGGMSIGVAFEGMEEGYHFYTLNIMNMDYEKDLALIKLHLPDTMSIRLGDSENINKGQEVVAIGNPFGLENTISDGIISGVRDIDGLEIIQTTTPISPGSSGGALLNMKGELLGITSMTNQDGQNLNFAIPSKYIKELLEDDITKLNMEISGNAGVFPYNESSIIFDCYNYYQNDRYLINLFANIENEMDFDIFASSSEFKDQIEEFYTKNISEIASKYNIKKYDFKLFAGRYTFSYRYENGKIRNKKWNENKDLARKKTSKEKILRVNLGDNFYLLDPQFNSSLTGNHVINNLFEGLMREEDGSLKYGIAKKYTISDDGKTYTFYLRNAKWSDGQPVKASDFEYSWKRALDPNSLADFAYLLFDIKGAQEYYDGTGSLEDVAIKVINDKTLRVTLNEPTPYFPRLTALPVYMPVRKDVVETNTETWFEDPSTLVSNGPFTMEEHIENFKVTLIKNKGYYGQESVKLDKVEMFMINDQAISLGAYEAGEFDIIDYVPLQEDENTFENESFTKVPTLGTSYYMFNVEKAPMDNVKVRKALSLAIDRKAIVDDVLNGALIPAAGLVPDGIYTSTGKEFSDLAGDYGISTDKADIDEAKKLLAEAGYPEGKDFPELVILYNEGTGNQKIAEAIKEMWEENLGIKVKLESVKWAEHLYKLAQGDFMIGRNGWLADFSDPVNFLELFTSYSTMNSTGWVNDEYDKLIQDSYIVSGSDRDKLLLEAEKILMDAMSVVPLYYYTDPILVKDYIKSWQRTGLGYWYFRNTQVK